MFKPAGFKYKIKPSGAARPINSRLASAMEASFLFSSSVFLSAFFAFTWLVTSLAYTRTPSTVDFYLSKMG
jgi:hypothetical protein